MVLPEIKRQIRRNARRLSLRVRAQGVVLTLPPHVPEYVIQQFLDASQAWLNTQWQAIGLAATAQPLLPQVEGDTVCFPAWSQQWVIVLSDRITVAQIQGEQLMVPAQQPVQGIKQWVLAQAKQYLPARLTVLAQRYGFTYQQCRVKHVVSRWGSCSSQGNINLNAALMLLPLPLIDYVLLHELCHTRQMNHTAAFWQQVALVDPLFNEHKRQLRNFKLPLWWTVL